MTVTFGTPDGSQNARPTFDDTNFQFVGVGPRDLVNMPIPYKGLNFGTGGADDYPASSGNLDGFFFKAITKDDGSGYGPDLNDGDVPIGPGHGNDYFDFVDDAQDAQIYMAWTAGTGVVSGAGDVDLVNDPGAFGGEAITGVYGTFKAWFPLSRVQETTFSEGPSCNSHKW